MFQYFYGSSVHQCQASVVSSKGEEVWNFFPLTNDILRNLVSYFLIDTTTPRMVYLESRKPFLSPLTVALRCVAEDEILLVHTLVDRSSRSLSVPSRLSIDYASRQRERPLRCDLVHVDCEELWRKVQTTNVPQENYLRKSVYRIGVETVKIYLDTIQNTPVYCSRGK